MAALHAEVSFGMIRDSFFKPRAPRGECLLRYWNGGKIEIKQSFYVHCYVCCKKS